MYKEFCKPALSDISFIVASRPSSFGGGTVATPFILKGTHYPKRYHLPYTIPILNTACLLPCSALFASSICFTICPIGVVVLMTGDTSGCIVVVVGGCWLFAFDRVMDILSLI